MMSNYEDPLNTLWCLTSLAICLLSLICGSMCTNVVRRKFRAREQALLRLRDQRLQASHLPETDDTTRSDVTEDELEVGYIL